MKYFIATTFIFLLNYTAFAVTTEEIANHQRALDDIKKKMSKIHNDIMEILWNRVNSTQPTPPKVKQSLKDLESQQGELLKLYQQEKDWKSEHKLDNPRNP
ncbi:MAG: hypothetical protein Q8L85_09070 [Alphaproteobacteria bacterium]|nr:hypothetical protein [Alphaproteobacteria bacterium]